MNLFQKHKATKYIFFLLITISFFLLLFLQIDTDYFWHIKAGDYMVHHGILRKDVFSWFMSGKYWMSHEWLFEIILYCLKIFFGKYHVIIYCFFSIISLLLILIWSNKTSFFKNIAYLLLYLMFFTIFMIPYVKARPHMLSFCFLAITLSLLWDLYYHKDSKKIFFLPVVAILWANIHGGSSNLSYLLCSLFLLGSLFSFSFPKIEAKHLNHTQIKKYLLVMLLCMIGVCINIHGFKMFYYPYQNMADTTMINSISEWQSTSLNEGYHYVFFAFLLFMILTILFSKKKLRWIDLIVLGFSIYLGLKSIRFWIFTYIFMSYSIFYYVPKRKDDSNTSLCIMSISIFLIITFLCNMKNLLSTSYEINLNSDLIQILHKEKPKRIYNMYNYGGELIYHDIPVFIDGRADLYSHYNYRDYLNISTLNGDFSKLIKQYNFDYFLVSKDYPIYTYLQYNSGYKVIYNEKNLVLFQKT